MPPSIGGPKLEASDSEVSLRSSELNASVDVERSSLSAEGTALSATAAGSRISATDSELSFLRSRVDLGVRGDPGSAISAEQSWFTQVHPSTGLSRDLLRARGPLTVRQCTFAMPEVLVTAQEMMGPTHTQFALVASGARAEVEDVLVLLARQDSYANFAAVVMANADASEPYHLRRGLVIGGTRQAQVSVIGRAEMEDWAGYDGVGHAISVDGGDIVLTRVEGARNESVVQLSASEPLLARLRDLRTFDCPTGLIVRSYGGSIDADISRIHLSGLRADGSGLSIRADAADGELAGPVRVVMRDVLVDAEVTRSMELGMDAVLDLQDFRFVGASYGIALRHRDRDQRPPHPHHLRRGSIHANLAGVLLSDLPAELHRLLDQVQVNATLPVLDPDPQ